jgi:hypothetical protein
MELLGNLLKLRSIEDVAPEMPKASKLCSRCVERSDTTGHAPEKYHPGRGGSVSAAIPFSLHHI